MERKGSCEFMVSEISVCGGFVLLPLGLVQEHTIVRIARKGKIKAHSHQKVLGREEGQGSQYPLQDTTSSDPVSFSSPPLDVLSCPT